MNRRLLALLLVVLVPAALVAADPDRSDAPRTGGDVAVVAVPVADPSEAFSSSWFCAMGTATPDAAAAGLAVQADLTVAVVNTGDVARAGTVEWYPTGGGERVTTAFEVPALSEVRLAAAESVQAPLVSAVVETAGGGVVVSHTVTGPRGSADAPCASDPSSAWHFANGVTSRDAVEVLALFNPYGDDVVVDIVAATEAGREEPADLEGVPVAAGSTVWVNLGDTVRRRERAAVSVRARAGRLVVDRLVSFDGSEGRTGTSLTVGARATAEVWRFPVGRLGPGEAEQWHIYNPNDEEALASVELQLVGADPPEPIDVVVPARSQVVVVAGPDTGVPPGVAHSALVRSLNGIGVVAERSVDRRAPLTPGWSSGLGGPVTSTRWLVPATGPATRTSARTEGLLGIANPGAATVTVSVTFLGDAGDLVPVGGLQGVAIPPGGQLVEPAAALAGHGWRHLLVEADGPVVVARDVVAGTGSQVVLQGSVALGIG